MSLLLCYSNDERAEFLSDGMSLDANGKPISRTTKKFFSIRSGAVIGACGFGFLRHQLRREFADFDGDFDSLLSSVTDFVNDANRRYAATKISKALGVILAGESNGRIASANIEAGRDPVVSKPGEPIFHICAASAEVDALARKLGFGILGLSDASLIPAKMREAAKYAFGQFPDVIGGTIFQHSLLACEFDSMQSQGSIIGGGDDSLFSFTQTSSELSFWNVAGSYPLPNGTTQSIPASGSSTSPAWSFSGLTADTVYHFGGYLNLVTNKVVVLMSDVSGGTAPGSQAWLIQKIQGDNHFPLFTDWTVATISSGSNTGGGTAGGGSPTCPADDQEVETQERGFIRADELQPGMHVRGWKDEWNGILAVRLVHGLLHHIAIAGETFHVDENHRWLPPGVSPDAEIGEWIRSRNLAPGRRVQAADGSILAVESISAPHWGRYVELRAERQRFRLGKIIAHNYLTQI